MTCAPLLIVIRDRQDVLTARKQSRCVSDNLFLHVWWCFDFEWYTNVRIRISQEVETEIFASVSSKRKSYA